MIRKAIQQVQETTRVVGHNVPVTKEQVTAFLNKKFGEIIEVSSFTVVGNMIDMLFVTKGGAGSYTTELKWVQKNIVFDN